MRKTQETILKNESSPEVGKLISLQVGEVQTYSSPQGAENSSRKWTSGIVKTPVTESVFCSQQGLDGDEQADRKNHGGLDKAILAYPYEHYARWKSEYPEKEWQPGGFGENFTLTGFNEFTVCIGDVFHIGDIVIQASEPRQPCYKLGRHWNMKDLPSIVIQNNRSGWYCRVLEPGRVAPREEIRRVQKGSQWTIAEVAYIIRHVGDDFDRAERLYHCIELSRFLRDFLRRAIDQHDPRKQPKTRNNLLRRVWGKFREKIR